jgi:hypothetical protein
VGAGHCTALAQLDGMGSVPVCIWRDRCMVVLVHGDVFEGAKACAFGSVSSSQVI